MCRMSGPPAEDHRDAASIAGRFPRAPPRDRSVEQLLDEPFVARKSPDAWRTFWLAADSRQGTPVQLGAEVSTLDECFEAILAERGMPFSQASTQRFYDRPGLAFIPVTDIPPTMLSVAWRTDVDSPVVRDFVDTAKAVASLSPIPDTWVPSRFTTEQTLSANAVGGNHVSPLRRVQ